MLISPAHAQAGGADMFTSFIPLILIFAVFYFLLVRPQQKKAKQHREMLAGIRRGDRIVTGGGLVGTVARVVNDDELLVDITDDVRVRVVRGMVANVLQRTAPADTADEAVEPEKSRKPRRRRRKPGGRNGTEPATETESAEEADGGTPDDEDTADRPRRTEGER